MHGVRLDLTRFAPESQAFVPAPWPAAMAGLKERLAHPPGSAEPRGLPRPWDPMMDDIPALVVPAPPAPTRPNGVGPGGRRPSFTVLLLDLEDRLASEGYRVESAGDGEEGLAKAGSEPYDLVILAHDPDG